MVWKDFQLVYTLSGHAQAVWAVLPLDGPDDLVLTGSSPFVLLSSADIDAVMMRVGAADNLIKLWRKDKEEITFKGHTQAVRALAKLDKGVGEGDLFASAGNDAYVVSALFVTHELMKLGTVRSASGVSRGVTRSTF